MERRSLAKLFFHAEASGWNWAFIFAAIASWVVRADGPAD